MAYITVPWNAFPISISTETHARVFIKGCVEVLGLGYHPDTPFAEYVGQDGKRLFSRKDAARLERLHGMLEGLAFDACEFAIAEWRRKGLMPFAGEVVTTPTAPEIRAMEEKLVFGNGIAAAPAVPAWGSPERKQLIALQTGAILALRWVQGAVKKDLPALLLSNAKKGR